jgi:hypothetical protein
MPENTWQTTWKESSVTDKKSREDSTGSLRTTRQQINVLAWKIHDCPPGYVGPCWGPTAADRDRAKAVLVCTSTPDDPQ